MMLSLSNKTTLLIFSCLVFLLTIVLWGANKGFDFTDESYYYIGYYFKIETNLSISFFHKIYLAFFGWMNLTIPELRILRALLMLSSIVFSSYSVAKYFSIKNKLELVAFASAFSFLSYAFYPNSISYNTFSSFFVSVLIGLVFQIKYTRHKLFMGGLIGFFSALLILNKFTNGLFLVVFALVFLTTERKKIYLFYTKKKKEFGGVFIAVILGSIIAIGFVFESITNVKESITELIKGVLMLEGHNLSSVITSYFYGLIHLVSNSKWLLLILTVTILILRNTPLKKSAAYVTALLLFLLFINGQSIIIPIGLYIPYFVFIVGLLLLKLFIEKSFLTKNTFFALFFIVAPFLVSFGTNNSPFIHFIFCGGLIGIGLFLLLINYSKSLKFLFVLFLLISLSMQVFSGFVIHPFRLNKNLLCQENKIENIPAFKGLSLDRETDQFISSVLELKDHPSKYIFTLTDLFAISLILDKQPYPFYWLNESNITNLSKVVSFEIDPEQLLIIIPEEQMLKSKTQEAFLKIGVNFTRDYSIIKSIKYRKATINFYAHNQTTTLSYK